MSSQLTAVETGALAGAQSGGFQSHAATYRLSDQKWAWRLTVRKH